MTLGYIAALLLFASFGLVLATFLFAIWVRSRCVDKSDDYPCEWYGM
ncbi:hypothetical protein [Rhodoplanes sp. Z2-YC6860]|nr:hypothetical protein [Rhodoplanes sp. Z2-YC6860]